MGFDLYFVRDAQEPLSRALRAAGAVPAGAETAKCCGSSEGGRYSAAT